jgi:ribosomal protein S18 acetylase RimI-like enzyme
MTTIDVRPVTPADWRAYREVRLAMLLDAPWAFGSTHSDALTIDDDGWRDRVASAEYWLAWCGGDPVGSVCLSDRDARHPGDVNIFGMWVDPSVRGRSVGDQLVRAALARARERGKARVLLHVVDTNTRARRLYERLGFTATGRTEPYPHDPDVREIEMACPL